MPVSGRVLQILCLIITTIRTRHPDLVSFLQKNPNAIFNVWLFWINQVHGKILDLRSPFSFLGATKIVQERTQLDVLMAIVLIAVIHPDFLDDALKEDADIDREIPKIFMDMFHELLDESVVNSQYRDGYLWLRTGNYAQMFEMVSDLKYPKWVLRTGIWMEHWNIFFGRIDPDGYGIFSIEFMNFEMMATEMDDESREKRLMLEDLGSFVTSFFKNLSLSYDDLIKIGNNRWDVKATLFLEKVLAELMKTKISQDAFDAGKLKDHSWLIAERKWKTQHSVNVENYMDCFFPFNPPGHETMASIFVYEFWQAHRKPDEIHSYREYLLWILQQHADKVSHLALKLLSSLENPERQPPVIPVQLVRDLDVSVYSNGEPKTKDLFCDYREHFMPQRKK
jgi:hypothetical protein